MCTPFRQGLVNDLCFVAQIICPAEVVVNDPKLAGIVGGTVQLPSVLNSPLQAILRVIDHVGQDSIHQPSHQLSQFNSFLELSSTEIETTLAILGERGSGKTTLLQFACSSLLQTGM